MILATSPTTNASPMTTQMPPQVTPNQGILPAFRRMTAPGSSHLPIPPKNGNNSR